MYGYRFCIYDYIIHHKCIKVKIFLWRYFLLKQSTFFYNKLLQFCILFFPILRFRNRQSQRTKFSAWSFQFYRSLLKRFSNIANIHAKNIILMKLLWFQIEKIRQKIVPRKRSVLTILGFWDSEINNFRSLDIRAWCVLTLLKFWE